MGCFVVIVLAVIAVSAAFGAAFRKQNKFRKCCNVTACTILFQATEVSLNQPGVKVRVVHYGGEKDETYESPCLILAVRGG